MKIGVVGTGYVGLVAGTCFADHGNDVVCVDINKDKVKQMNNGDVPIYEPGLEEMFLKNIKAGRLSFTNDLSKGVRDTDVVFLALPTPSGEDGSADLSYILQAAQDLAPLINTYTVIVDKSTVPVGTADKVKEVIRKGTSQEFDVVSNPEFLKEGFAVEDFLHPDRILVGADSERALKVMRTLYKEFIVDETRLIEMDIRSAEMTKYAANSFLAAKISFINEIANLCEQVGADIDNVRMGMGSDSRIGHKFLYPGIGYGGSCFPKDVQALLKTAQDHGADLSILRSVESANAKQKTIIFGKIKDYLGDLNGKKIAVWGLSFKPNTDDIREAPAIVLIKDLLQQGVNISAYDPVAIDNARRVFGEHDNVHFAQDKYDALQDADALVIATEWSEFHTADLSKMKDIAVFDGRNIFEPATVKNKLKFYTSIGRP
jgi:UDPglucose 6-dehydrogenase